MVGERHGRGGDGCRNRLLTASVSSDSVSSWENHLIYILFGRFFKELSCYYSAITRNVTESFAETWMTLETVIQSEESQTEKYKYRVLTRVWNPETQYR